MELHFDKNKLLEIIQAVKDGSGHRVPYTGGDWGRPEDNTPGIMIVGDQGIYIIGNHEPKVSPEKDGHVAYSLECNPSQNFEDWWEMKRATFGGDDGAEFIPLETAKKWVESGKDPFIEFKDNGMALASYTSR